MTCPRHNEVVRAANSGLVAPEIARHITECVECSETAGIARTLVASAIETKIERGDARILWLLAAERRHAAAEQKLNRVIHLVPALATVIAIVATVIRVVLTGSSPIDGLLGASGKIGPVFLIAAAFVVLLVWTAPMRRRSS
jgi:hypothetical protein